MKIRSSLSAAAMSAALSLAPLFAAAGHPAGDGPLERPGTGEPVCGLGHAFHGGRRAALRERLERGAILVRGLPDTRAYERFHQDKVFWYLTGVESPNAALLMDAESGREVLFLPPPNARSESWDGEMWDAADPWVGDLTGFGEVRPLSELDAELEKLAKKRRKVWISMHPHVELGGCFDRATPYDRRREKDPLDGRPSREKALKSSLEKRLKADVADLSPALNELRRVKTPEEIEAMRRAGRAGALAMVEAMRSTAPGVGEWEIEALMSWIQVREGATGPAYHGIVGSGPNSLVLHYSASSRRLGPGEVLLVDYGPELDHYTTDITRTWPVSGRFSERQAELYDAVLAAQRAGIAAVEPGRTLRDVERACAEILKARGLGHLTRHGACHYIGMEVHDVGAYDAPFVPGVAFTVEPGLYEEETGIGIRIEDVVVVTEEGCEVLTDAVPAERAEVEALVASEGVLDWMGLREE